MIPLRLDFGQRLADSYGDSAAMLRSVRCARYHLGAAPAKVHSLFNGAAIGFFNGDVLKLRDLVTSRHYDRGLGLLEEVVAMLTKMVK